MQQRIVLLVYLLTIEYFCFCITVHILRYEGWSFKGSAAEDISMNVKYAKVLLRCTVAGVGLESMQSCSAEEVDMKVCAEEGWTRKYAVLQWREATDLEVCASLLLPTMVRQHKRQCEKVNAKVGMLCSSVKKYSWQ